MRAVPIPTAARGTGRSLPTPVVRSNFVRQTVDLKPAGNTVSVTTLADNPFESGQDVEVVTQASGGMAPPPESMQSKRVMHSFMPGIGQSATETQAKDESGPGGFTQFIDTAGGLVNRHFDQQVAREERRAAQARAEADIARAQADGIMARTTANVGGFQFNWALVALGALGLGAAFMLSRGKK